jgi:hypothetical protein
MITRIVATITAASLAVLMPTLGFTSMTVCLLEQGRAFVAYNYDFHPSEGVVLVNKRGTRKQSRVEPQGARWTARHGSITLPHPRRRGSCRDDVLEGHVDRP